MTDTVLHLKLRNLAAGWQAAAARAVRNDAPGSPARADALAACARELLVLLDQPAVERAGVLSACDAALHPNGRCLCDNEGLCTWCRTHGDEEVVP